ncbi:MAG TPA: endolytic transglycosylase MltG, partial [Chitinophagaceae bacterium]|nr:endolytic transglycosylase MltG [Chitinophagaceae bacterium]
LDKIGRNYLKFWTAERKAKAAKQSMTQAQIITLASIVEEETNIPEDKLKIASTYMNRIHLGMPLQADPTLKFAVNDFTLRRLLTVHTQVNSPYNTYVHAGLPPGPICTPSMKTIDAVLDAPKTTYLYFCAREDFKGYSNFASTYAEHQQNARRYQAALNARGIKK